MTTACFTGHRKIGANYYNRHNPSPEWHTLQQYMNQIVQGMCGSPYQVDHYISGLAIGVDMLGAECVAYVRSFLKTQVNLTGAMPFPSQPNRWPEPTRNHWDDVCQLCNKVVAVSADPYSPQKMQIRNQWMVDQSHYVIAVWNGVKKGGTWNCMQYALSQGKSVLILQQTHGVWDCKWAVGDQS